MCSRGQLTRMLQESLGGNSRTALIMNCSPAAYNVLETVSTLRFGTRAKKIRNKPVVNKERSMEEMKVLVEMKDREISRLHKRVAELEAASTPRQGARRMSSFGSGRKCTLQPRAACHVPFCEPPQLSAWVVGSLTWVLHVCVARRCIQLLSSCSGA